MGALRSISVTISLAAVLLAASRGAVATGIRQERRLLARSTDGASALLELRAWGPEGGGSLTFRVEGKVRRKGIDYLVSSDFSPGNGTQPQQVPAATCEQRLAALTSELSKRGIHGVAVNPERCRTEDRDGLVTVASPPAATK